MKNLEENFVMKKCRPFLAHKRYALSLQLEQKNTLKAEVHEGLRELFFCSE